MSGTLSDLWRRLGDRWSRAAGADNPPSGQQDAVIWGEKKLIFLDTSAKEFDLESLSRGSAEILGTGAVGTSYKAVLDDGRTVVVKRLRDVALPMGKFRNTMNALGAMRHENLLPLKAYSYSRDEKLLLFDYVPLRSLYGLLHGGIGSEKTLLSWEIRRGIALGAARAIEYLHSQGPNVFHGNFKSTNVLLTASYDPLVSDYGLTHIQAPPQGPAKAADRQKDDAYSFGVMLVELLTGKMTNGADLAKLVKPTTGKHWTFDAFDPELGDYQNFRDELMGLLQVAMACASDLPQRRPSMSKVRRMIEDRQSRALPDQIIEENGNLSKRTRENFLRHKVRVAEIEVTWTFWFSLSAILVCIVALLWKFYYRNLPEGGVLEVSDRVYVFEYCLTTDWLKDDEYEFHMRGIVAKLQDQFPAASFMVLNFREGENHSQMARVLSEYGITVIKHYQNYGGCPIPRVEIIRNFLRSADEWLSSDAKTNVLLMHCERGAWPVLAFMLASLLLYRKKQDGEQKTLNMIYNKAPHELLQLTSTLNPLPSQLRYLQYVSMQNAGSDWPAPNKLLVIKSVRLSSIPHLDVQWGCQIIGPEPFIFADQTPKVLSSTPYEQAEGEKVKFDMLCYVRDDVVLEFMSLDADLEHGESMFRAMFNTAFISESVLKLMFEDMDVSWDHQDQYPKDFMAEIDFSQVNADASLEWADLSSDEVEKENQLKESMRKIESEELPAEGNLPNGGMLEVSDRVCVFEYCLSTDWLKDDECEVHMRGVVAKLQDQFPAASFKVLNFGEGENHSHLARVLFEYDITVIKLPQNNGGCPIPRVEIIRDFLRSADEWLSSDAKTNMLLMHCERGAWPVLAFMLASLLLYRKKQDGEQKTLNMIYNKAPHELLQLTSTLNPLPSQLRYLQYVSMQNASSDWPALNKLLVIKSVRLSSVPHLDVQWGCQIIGQEPFIFADQTLKVLSATPYKQVEGEKVQFNVFCYVRDDVVLEFMSLDADLEHGESMFRAMFNTAFISDSVLKLMFEDMDVSWDHKDQYPKEFMAEIDFFQVNADTLLEWADLSGDEVEKENRSKKSIGKIEPKELPAEERAVHFMTLNYDASTSPEENEVLELPIQSNIEPTSTLPQVPTSPSESLADSALEGTFESFELATKSPYTSPSVELDQQSGTAVEGNGLSFSLSDVTGENTEIVRGEEKAAVTETNMEVTSVSDSASSSAVNNGSVEATAAGVSNSVQFPDMMLPKQERLYQHNDSPSSTSMSSRYDYDVFLSFRGPDTRSGITDFLYTRLRDAKIHTFRDNEELRIGEELGPELLKAIRQSKIAIPIFSKGYASSKWCLNELVQMVQCHKKGKQKIMPIFYDVTPAEVRHQIGSYKEDFLLHEKNFGAIISEWKTALNHVAHLKGWDNSKNDRGEGELVNEIVQKVIKELKTPNLLGTDSLVGVEHHVNEIDRILCGNSEDIKILGIYGMVGVGKTTLAKIIYNWLSNHFEACCFLSGVRETSQLKGIECLQNQLLSDILKRDWWNISNVEYGIKTINERLLGKKVLVLLDDVDERIHLNALMGRPMWLGKGSILIITSRNTDVFNVLDVCCKYELTGLDVNQSLQLFCKHAFRRDHPLDGYATLSNEVVKMTGGLPLALEVIGLQLFGKNKDYWDVTLQKLEKVPHMEVRSKLEVCYDALDHRQKKIFLDIACFYIGCDKGTVLQKWTFDLFPGEALQVLQQRSLIKIGEDNKLWMHVQLRDFGRDLVSVKLL